MLTKAVRRTVMILLLLTAGITAPLFAQSENLITSIRITGLKRTRLPVAEEPLRRFIGQEAAAFDTDQARAVILDQGILEPLAVTIEDDGEGPGRTLVVEVREKWAIFPIPVFFAGSSGISGGAAFFDANAFGLNHKMGVVGMYQHKGWFAMALYAAPPGGSGRFGWSSNVFFAEGERRNSDAEDETLRRFKTRSIAAGVSPQYRFNDALGVTLQVSYHNTMLLDTEDPVREPDSGAQIVQLGPNFSFHRSSWDGYLLSEEGASVNYHFIWDPDSSPHHSLSFRGMFEKPLVPGFRLSLRGGGLYRPDAPVLLESGPGESAVNILPNAFSAQYYGGLSLGLEKYLYRFSFGTLSLFGAWQMVYSSGPLLGGRFDYGVTGAMRFYMSRLAIPAMGFGVAYNIPADYFQFSFSIGMTL